MAEQDERYEKIYESARLNESIGMRLVEKGRHADAVYMYMLAGENYYQAMAFQSALRVYGHAAQLNKDPDIDKTITHMYLKLISMPEVQGLFAGELGMLYWLGSLREKQEAAQ